MGVVDDLSQGLQAARSERLWYETNWREHVTYTAPDMEKAFDTPAGISLPNVMTAMRHNSARERSRTLYDATPVLMLDRLVSGAGAPTMPEGFLVCSPFKVCQRRSKTTPYDGDRALETRFGTPFQSTRLAQRFPRKKYSNILIAPFIFDILGREMEKNSICVRSQHIENRSLC